MSFEKTHTSLKYYFIGRNFNYALIALNLAKKHHTGLRKDNITPEIAHQYEICLFAMTLSNLINEELLLTTILLHDILEDYDLDKNQILNLFGSKSEDKQFGQLVLDAVWKLTKVYKGVKKSKEEYFSAIAECPIASLAKICDRNHNLQSMVGVFSLSKCKEYIQESKDHFIPLIKEAQHNFPAQSKAYLNAERMLKNQIFLIEKFIEASNPKVESK